MAKCKDATIAIRTVRVELPIGDLTKGGYPGPNDVSGHVEARLNRRRLLALARLHAGFMAKPQQMRSGGFVGSNSNIIQHMLDQVADAIDKPGAE